MRSFWLASYPKSGNTWLRLLLAGIALKDGEALDINAFPSSGPIASARRPFEYHLLLDTTLLDHDEIDALRPDLYAVMASNSDYDGSEPELAENGVRYMKVHDAYTRLSDGRALLGGYAGAAGAVVIVRDPRDVAPSLANHNGVGIDQAIDQLNDPATVYCGRSGDVGDQLRQRLLDWSGHVASWLDQSDLPVHLLRYEDLMAQPQASLAAVLAFAGQAATPDQIARAVALAQFDALKAQEAEKGFNETSRRASGFFRQGKAGGWKSELTAAQVRRIETAHSGMMRRLGYERSGLDQGGEAAA